MSTVTRRDFAQQLALGLGLSTASAPAANAAEEPEKKDPPPRPPTLAELILTGIVQQYPSEHYSDDVIEGLFSDIRSDLARGRELSKFPLQNGDEPAFVFAVYRSDRPHGGPPKATP
ncbi:MAG: hypothetical protein Q8K78_07810 [Planctomycetaceae bacterium]|nr:hypothetical protein [Planctomycetaceae bacterium]